MTGRTHPAPRLPTGRSGHASASRRPGDRCLGDRCLDDRRLDDRCLGAIRPNQDAGFTLLEIVVALVVLGILLLTLSHGTRFGLAAFDRQNRMAETAGRLDAVDRTLRRLLGHADPGTATDGRSLTGAAHGVVFRAPLPRRGGDAPDDNAMANLRLGVERHALVLFSTPYRHVIPVGPEPDPLRTVLLDGVEAVDLSYWSAGTWRTRWDENTLPELVRIRISFPDGDPRRWPDIVVAPVLQQGG